MALVLKKLSRGIIASFVEHIKDAVYLVIIGLMKLYDEFRIRKNFKQLFVDAVV